MKQKLVISLRLRKNDRHLHLHVCFIKGTI